MLRVGITGGIGSGKSIVARVFANLGIPVYNADTAAKRLMESDPGLIDSIKKTFGNEAYSGNKLNRSFIAGIVFRDKQKLRELNELVHPVTILDGETWMKQQSSPYALKEAALIFESGAQAQLDLVIGVSAPLHLRIHRVMQRDNISREEVLKRMDNQISDTIKMRLCDYVITNDDIQLVLPQVLKVHETILAKAEEKI
ncbi:dephospho-CoA kinase [Flavihumibacter stibioxidans]|uniref:Dephospho-CoA kinase n=1 Tax=Flavihumibacter stibioxidans TaxID=1834163 RepID=A0ABR7M4N0_9BACT|nr:dephospho-CoA kinase [Flavihumibacter stibioxidans]MBC6489965.1 dephospho-CoA kinase [Flavihumibacter stibioxidans]